MHALILGDLKDHSMRFLDLASAGALLKKTQGQDEQWQNAQSYGEPPFADHTHRVRNPRMKRKRADPVDDTSAADRPKKKNPTKSQPGKKNLYNSYAADEEAETEDDCQKAPGLSAEELDVFRRTILHTVLPSWIDRLPRNLGAANHGSLKAAEWLILYKVYYTIALIPLWVKGLRDAATEESRRRISLLLESTSTLSQITHFLTLPKIKLKDLSELDAWAQERVKGMLQRLPTNHHLDQIPKTLITKWHINSNLASALNDPTFPVLSGGDDSDTKDKVTFTLDQPLFQKWQRAVVGNRTSRGRRGLAQSDLHLNPAVERVQSVLLNRKSFTCKQQHRGNCLVEFVLGKSQRFGETEIIFRSNQTPNKTWMVINPFDELRRDEDPYGDYPDLNCRLVKTKHDSPVVIDSEHVIGHVAIMQHGAGTFGLPGETISAVGLATAVSLFSYNSVCFRVFVLRGTFWSRNAAGLGGTSGELI
ncbi:hypothetical protein PTTG_27200 [Puccinia triticina 1-1 BBBD Race 1]|uniref:Uncharacterized protein n=1 Tax=Puccinia triticina (isolate 1-1 / race 1 (BBBD)) TaxID=630390 RepID=A0A180GLU7_PUCT1|nr:hypothetical protein PTTG_27200 [Puccinia triticina 1-1 BBBD Race 1]